MTEKSEKRKATLKAAQRKYYERNKDELKAKAKLRYAEIAAQKKAWKLANADHCREVDRKWRQENAEYIRECKRLSKFGITPEQHQAMLIAQNNKCDICGRDQSEFKNRFAVDHSHSTGKVRSLLCGPCNSALGLLRESITVIDNLKLYLLKHMNGDEEHARSE